MPERAPAASSEIVDLAIVIVSYHCRADVLACVASVVESMLDHSFDVVVVDNGSTDGTADALRLEFPDLTVVEMGENAGFARATNLGIAISRSRHVLLLNPDTVVEVGALDRLVAWLDEHPDVGVVAPSLRNADGTDQLTARAFPTPSAALFGRRSPLTRLFPRNRWSRRFLTGRDHVGDEPFAIDWVSGACMMVPRSVVDHVGALDPAFFLYWEDADWCRRIGDAGYSVWCVPKARVTHDEGGTRGHAWPTPIVVQFHRGAYQYWSKHHAPQPWNPMRWLAGIALSARAASIIGRQRVHSSRFLRSTASTASVVPGAAASSSHPVHVR